MKRSVTHTTKAISYVVAGLSLFLPGVAKADIISQPPSVLGNAGPLNISVTCKGADFYKEGPDGKLTCTIINPFQNVLNATVSAALVNNGSIDSGDVARDPTVQDSNHCLGKITKAGPGGTPAGTCAFDVTFSTDEKTAPKTEVENIDSGTWLLTATVTATSPKFDLPKTASGQFNILVVDAPEPSSLFLIGIGVLLLAIPRVLVRVRSAYFSRTTSTLPNFSSAGPICLASPTTTIAD